MRFRYDSMLQPVPPSPSPSPFPYLPLPLPLFFPLIPSNALSHSRRNYRRRFRRFRDLSAPLFDALDGFLPLQVPYPIISNHISPCHLDLLNEFLPLQTPPSTSHKTEVDGADSLSTPISETEEEEGKGGPKATGATSSQHLLLPGLTSSSPSSSSSISHAATTHLSSSILNNPHLHSLASAPMTRTATLSEASSSQPTISTIASNMNRGIIGPGSLSVGGGGGGGDGSMASLMIHGGMSIPMGPSSLSRSLLDLSRRAWMLLDASKVESEVIDDL